jgi:hypothetical protein
VLLFRRGIVGEIAAVLHSPVSRRRT